MAPWALLAGQSVRGIGPLAATAGKQWQSRPWVFQPALPLLAGLAEPRPISVCVAKPASSAIRAERTHACAAGSQIRQQNRSKSVEYLDELLNNGR